VAYSRELPTTHVPVHVLAPQLLVACWTDANNMPVSPSDVMSRMDDFPDHAARIRAADMSWCILLDKDNTVIDGMHRLCRAVLDGDWVTMCAKYVPDDMMKQAAICTQCGAHPVAVLCDICSLAGYCSTECRERHWPMHSTRFCQRL
jgi:ribosomal protein L37E